MESLWIQFSFTLSLSAFWSCQWSFFTLTFSEDCIQELWVFFCFTSLRLSWLIKKEFKEIQSCNKSTSKLIFYIASLTSFLMWHEWSLKVTFLFHFISAHSQFAVLKRSAIVYMLKTHSKASLYSYDSFSSLISFQL